MTIQKIINEQGGFITADDVASLSPKYANLGVLVRTGMNRCVCRLDALDRVHEEVELNGDYIRDVSLTIKNFDSLKDSNDYFAGPDNYVWKF